MFSIRVFIFEFESKFWLPASQALKYHCWYGFIMWMENSVNPDQLVSYFENKQQQLYEVLKK